MSRYGLRTRSGQIAPIIQTIRGQGQKIAAIYGYFAGGYSTARAATADRITFSTSTTAAQTSANLSLARNALAGLSDGAV